MQKNIYFDILVFYLSIKDNRFACRNQFLCLENVQEEFNLSTECDCMKYVKRKIFPEFELVSHKEGVYT